METERGGGHLDVDRGHRLPAEQQHAAPAERLSAYGWTHAPAAMTKRLSHSAAPVQLEEQDLLRAPGCVAVRIGATTKRRAGRTGRRALDELKLRPAQVVGQGARGQVGRERFLVVMVFLRTDRLGSECRWGGRDTPRRGPGST